jgi:hypothetical protein
MKTRTQKTLGSTIALAALTLALAMTNAQAVMVTENFSSAAAVAYNYTSDNYVNDSLSATTGDGFSASFSPSFVTGPSGATFSSGSVNLAQDGTGNAYVYGYVGFTVDANVTYSFSGSLSGNATGENNQPVLSAYLWNPSTYFTYYESEYESSANIGSYAFTLGDGLVNSDGYMLGSASGTLSPGTYEIYFEHQLYGAGEMDGVGDFTFTLAAVPEPSTYLAGALLLLPFGVQGLRRLRNRRQVA